MHPGYFDGLVWIDNHDLAIVKSYGKWMTEIGPITPPGLPFTMFETYREAGGQDLLAAGLFAFRWHGHDQDGQRVSAAGDSVGSVRGGAGGDGCSAGCKCGSHGRRGPRSQRATPQAQSCR